MKFNSFKFMCKLSIILSLLLVLSFALPAYADVKAPAKTVTVSVLDKRFGAKGDGKTNDRARIQKAIDYVAAQSNGGTVTLPGKRTYLSGDLNLKSNVTLNIEKGAVLLQSKNPSDYTKWAVPGHNYNNGVVWATMFLVNRPLIFAGPGTSNVKLTGQGTVRMQRSAPYNGTDKEPGPSCKTTIHVVPVAFSGVEGFTISGITITQSNSYTVCLWGCNSKPTSSGLVNGITIKDTADVNGDGISIVNSQNIRITGNTLHTSDDAMYVDANWGPGPGDPMQWSYNPKGTFVTTRNIEFDHNNVIVRSEAGDVPECHGFCFIPWGNRDPDKSEAEISNIRIHDNTLDAKYPIGVWPDNPNTGNGLSDGFDYSSVKDITFYNNKCIGPIQLPSEFKITNLKDDFGVLSSDTLLNGDFENTGVTSWSVKLNTDPLSAGASNKANLGQDGSWFGYIDHLDKGDAAIYEGLGLIANTQCTFTAKVQSSGDTARLFVKDANTGKLISSQEFNNTTWESKSLSFTIPATGNYNIGLERGNAQKGWARIDTASMSKTLPLPFSDNFDNNATPSKPGSVADNAAGWTGTSGNWTVAKDASDKTDGSYVYKGDVNAASFVGDPTWKDYEVTARVKMTSFVCYPIIYARKDPSSSNSYYFDYTGSQLRINKIDQNGCTELVTKKLMLLGYKWYEFKAVVKGSTLEFYVDGEKQLETTDTSYASGLTGLGTYSGTASFDDFSVRQVQ